MSHGTRDPDGVSELLRLAQAVQTAAGHWQVEIGVLEFPGPVLPSIAGVIDRCAAGGIDRVAAVPLLLHQAGHSKQDMPQVLADALHRHPDVQFGSCPSLGVHPSLFEILEERASQAVRGRAPIAPAETTLLLVARGSSDAEANADFFRVARLVWERGQYGNVECCFVSLTGPAVADGIDRCVRLGARRVLVVPYFLSTGILVKRISTQAEQARTRHPGVEILVGNHLGIHQKIVDLILERADVVRGRLSPAKDNRELAPAGT
jgi:sirohydrochlorin cobaltochelatase